MKSRFTIVIEFESRPRSSDLIKSVHVLAMLIAKFYSYPFKASGSQTLGFGDDRQTVQWQMGLAGPRSGSADHQASE